MVPLILAGRSQPVDRDVVRVGTDVDAESLDRDVIISKNQWAQEVFEFSDNPTVPESRGTGAITQTPDKARTNKDMGCWDPAEGKLVPC